jgi:hypothetical protein
MTPEPDVFAQSLLQQTPVVYGHPMRPLSCFHIALLYTLDSPFVTPIKAGDKESMLVADVVMAAFVCSLEFPDGAKHFFPEVDFAAISGWGIANGAPDHDLELDRFVAYLDDHFISPEVWESEESGKECGTPWWFRLPANVMSEYSQISERDAWNMGIPRLQCYRASVGESKYGWELVTGGERADIRKLEDA